MTFSKALFCCLTCIFPPAAGLFAQCSFPLILRTTKDYCVGSSLLLSSDHALQKIVWYRDGVAVDSIFAAESLDKTGAVVTDNIYPSAICLDNADNLYVSDYPNSAVKKYVPGSTTGTIVAGGHGKGNGPDQFNTGASIRVDDQGNLYIFDPSGGRIIKWLPGAPTGVTLLKTNVENANFEGAHALLIDCAGNIFLGDNYRRLVQEWKGGTGAPETLFHLQPLAYIDNEAFAINIEEDGAGNLLVLDGSFNALSRYPPGDTTGLLIAGTNKDLYGTDGKLAPYDFWLNRDDTAYICYLSAHNVVQLAPGGGSGTVLFSGSSGGLGLPACIARDIKGNFFVGDQGNSNVREYKLTSFIDTSFTPVAPGRYYAVVKDMLGNTRTSDTIFVNTPNAGLPSIGITATATSAPVCVPIAFTATVANEGATASYQWEVSGVKVGDGSLQYSNNLFANGDKVYCILTEQNGCLADTVSDTSNVITLAIDPQGTASVAIAADPPIVCGKHPIVFTATVTNGSNQPVFQWLVNGAPLAGDDGAIFSSDGLKGGDIVYCRITNDDICGLAKSNSVPVIVGTAPVIPPGQLFTIPYGKTLQLDPVINGEAATWLWTPSLGLSDPKVADPIASPLSTTKYLLKAISPQGCSDSGTIVVDVFTPASLPTAFTPNGDGRNDIFYMLGAPTGSRIVDFAVYDRWGQAVFRVHDAMPGDPTAGWNGYIHGQAAPIGTYPYQLILETPDRQRHNYSGTVVLIR
ncbi:MAG TPA: gliding motility-associated C-terminal domain-containing protein [Puia sp.]|uniref:T9SS type B sorting domain-containing protein n=1 Tax=Puia sp. TaxID=2045100 RepID=UPI002C983AB6|nr:gliding motility-associated C-terminal domain-containing protein [Puia sp.]HVU94854.1 gliding motility-associated C-terminal domain-containing protein [Puia sp.]